MGRLAEAIDSEIVRKGPPCEVGLLLERMDTDDKKDFLARLGDASVTCTIIHAKLVQFDYHASVFALRRHRNKMLRRANGCACQV